MQAVGGHLGGGGVGEEYLIIYPGGIALREMCILGWS